MIIDEVLFKIEQTAEQAAVQTVRIGYAYTIRAPQTADYDGTIDILGDDVLSDDELAMGVDAHQVQCIEGQDQRVERSLLVGQKLLDEDIGTDEIKLRINVACEGEPTESVMTPIIRGDF